MSNETKQTKQQNKTNETKKIDKVQADSEVSWCEAYDRMLKGEKFIFTKWSKTFLSDAYVFVPRGQTKPMIKFLGKPERPFAPSVEEVTKKCWKLKNN